MSILSALDLASSPSSGSSKGKLGKMAIPIVLGAVVIGYFIMKNKNSSSSSTTPSSTPVYVANQTGPGFSGVINPLLVLMGPTSTTPTPTGGGSSQPPTNYPVSSGLPSYLTNATTSSGGSSQVDVFNGQAVPNASNASPANLDPGHVFYSGPANGFTIG